VGLEALEGRLLPAFVLIILTDTQRYY